MAKKTAAQMHALLHQVPASLDKPMKALAHSLASCLFLLAAGCTLVSPRKHSVELVSLPFECGTNSVLDIEQTLRDPGTYRLYLVLRTQELPRDKYARTWLDARFHVLVSTNGQPLLDKEVSHLQRNTANPDSELTAYTLATFHINQKRAVNCHIEETGDGTLQAHGTLNLQLFRSNK